MVIPKLFQTVLLLIASNVFMTFAWYGHLRNSWGIALMEYLLQVPANRIGSGVASVAQLKIIQEAISLSVFVPFALLYLREKWTWNFLWAAMCILGAIFFMFRR